jgi:hypothetical protein
MEFSIKPTKLHFETISNLPKVVRKVEYSIIAVDGADKVQSEHTAHVGALDTSKFIKFDDLTEAAVIGWIKDGIGDYYGVLCNHLSDQIQEMKTNTNGSKTPPWLS